MRCTQPMGLPAQAEVFLAQKTKRRNPCTHCDRDDGPVKKEVASVGMYDDLPLYQYELKDGGTATEFVQKEEWSSGPMIWVALRLSDGTTIEWDPAHMTEDWDPEAQVVQSA